MNNPLVSVIIPNYNHSRFLDERLQSVLHQTYQHFEVIILDDHSTDNSIEIINKYRSDEHVSHIVVNEQNSGSTFKQWHKGFELAKGEIIWIAESDDSCDSTLLEKLVKGYMANHAVLAFCRSCKYDHDGNKYYYSHQEKLEENLPMHIQEVSMSGQQFITQYMTDGNLIANASSAIFSLEKAISIDREYMNMRGEGDLLFWIEMLEQGNVYYHNETLNYFRFHESNTTSLLTQKGVGVIEHKKIFDYLVKHGYYAGTSVLRERMRYVQMFLLWNYESHAIRRQVLHAWDKYRIYVLMIFAKRILGSFYFLLKNLV